MNLMVHVIIYIMHSIMILCVLLFCKALRIALCIALGTFGFIMHCIVLQIIAHSSTHSIRHIVLIMHLLALQIKRISLRIALQYAYYCVNYVCILLYSYDHHYYYAHPIMIIILQIVMTILCFL